MIHIQFAFSSECVVPSGEAADTNFEVFRPPELEASTLQRDHQVGSFSTKKYSCI